MVGTESNYSNTEVADAMAGPEESETRRRNYLRCTHGACRIYKESYCIGELCTAGKPSQGPASGVAWPRLDKARPEAAIDHDDGFEMLSCVLEREARWNYEREGENTTDWTVVLRFGSRREREGKGEAVRCRAGSRPRQDRHGKASR